MTAHQLMQKLIGKWTGTCRTWFEPDVLADESAINGEITAVFDGRFLRHTYAGSMDGRRQEGEELISQNDVTKRFQIAWIDSYHMNYAIQFSEGEALPRGFSVFGRYDVAEDQPQWGWRTVYELSGNDHLTITAFNVSPEGEEMKAVETVYERVE